MIAILASLLMLVTNLLDAQVDTPIGRHYENRHTLNSHSQLEFDNFWSPPIIVDLNGDGKDDVVFSELSPDIDGPSVFFIWVANESGILENVTLDLIQGSIPNELRGSRQIIARDFNGDGRPDLFLEAHGPEPNCGDIPYVCWPGAQNQLLLSNPDGNLINVTTTHLPQFSDFTHGSTALDFDNDGDLDIWVNNLGGPIEAPFDPKFPYLLQNDGSGRFTIVSDAAMGDQQMPIIGLNGILPGLPGDGEWGVGSWSIAIDANGDNFMDLWFGLGWEWYPSPHICFLERCRRNFLLVNDGLGHFSFLPEDSSSLPDMVELASYQNGQVYDFNRDGLDDQFLLIDLPEVIYFRVLISNGDGTFHDETIARYPNEPVYPVTEVQFHDLDGDGHKDLFRHVGGEAGSVEIRVNDGEGNFRPLKDNWVKTKEHFWVVLDVDGDGGTDFLINDAFGYTLSKMNLPYGPELDGTSEENQLIGGAHNNVYRGMAGNDVLDGGLGDDFLDGGAGNDELLGGKGHDELIGGKGNDSYKLYSADLSSSDTILDISGNDIIRFTDFGLDRIQLATNTESGDLLLSFDTGEQLTVLQHFRNSSYRVERLEAGDCAYRISGDPSFVSGPVTDLLGDCIIFDNGFE